MSGNDELAFERMANEDNAERHRKADAPVHQIYAALLECAHSHMENGDVTGSETIINALQFALQSARNWVSKYPTTAAHIADQCNY